MRIYALTCGRPYTRFVTLVVGGAALASALVSVPAAPVEAQTTVSGQNDTSPSLVIDPTQAPQPMTVTRTVHMETVMVLQRMPVTKRIQSITVGDFAWADGCTAAPAAYLFIREHPNGDASQGGTSAAWSTTAEPLPASAGRVTWTFPSSTTLYKNRTYSFVLYQNGGCSQAKMTSWKHNSSTVDPGPLSCSRMPRLVNETGALVDLNVRRMWHEPGADDDVTPCVNTSTGFDPSMPGGWLLTSSSGTYWGVPMHRHWAKEPAGYVHQHCGNDRYANAGLSERYWRAVPRSDGLVDSDYVCRWTQFADHGPVGADLDGWYYSMPWIVGPTGQGHPRTTYLKLDTIDYQALLNTYAPRLKFDSSEQYWADSPGVMTDAPNTYLHDSETIVKEDFNGLSYLGAEYPHEPEWLPDTYTAEPDDYLDSNGDSDTYWLMRQSAPSLLNRAYGRPLHGPNGDLILQYWLFYYHQPDFVLGMGGEHEGDWEMVQVHLGANDVPSHMALAQHTDGYCILWSNVEKGPSPQTPNVYVAEGSHASYAFEGDHPTAEGGDGADGDGAWLTPIVDQIDSTVAWNQWPGSWGAQGGSPEGPAFQSEEKWSDPEQWSREVAGCPE